MKLLLDTHLLLWAVLDSPRLSRKMRSIIDDMENDLFFSVASIWEIAIKQSLGRGNAPIDTRLLRRELLDHGYAELPILSEHAVAVITLPPVHKDPFDRLLVAQAIVEGITLLTVDSLIAKYPGPVQKL